VVCPKRVKTDVGLLLIGGGSNKPQPPERADRVLAAVAEMTGSVVAELRQVPNEPVSFSDEQRKRTEDEIIAYTWDKFLKTGDESWPLRLPMAKSVVRAMDAVTETCRQEANGLKVDRFVVAGASKRGWTAWAVAAVDKRVVGIIPMVIDVLNVRQSFEHHFRAYGFWAPAVHDYVEMKIMDWMDRPEFAALMRIEDPYAYRDRLTMPKLLLNSSGDQFFLPDSWRFYFDDLPGEKHLRYVPNTDHSLRKSDARKTVVAFYDMLLKNSARPQFSWKLAADGALQVTTITRPSKVKLWQATNPKARDFRLEALGPAWKSSSLKTTGSGEYIARVQPPAQGWTAYFVELTFPTSGRFSLKLTTGVYVTPDTLLHPPPAAAQRPNAAVRNGASVSP
jgi:PhoPQ-activated pathogenicity-related protein